MHTYLIYKTINIGSRVIDENSIYQVDHALNLGDLDIIVNETKNRYKNQLNESGEFTCMIKFIFELDNSNQT